MKQNSMWWLLVAIAAILAFWLTWGKEAGYVDQSATRSPSPSQSRTATATPRAGTTPKGTPFNESYSSLVSQYAGRRIQFNALCQANPSRLSIAKGSMIMLDNRSGDARVIKVGSSSVSLPGYGYHLMTMRTSGDYAINCGAAVNVGTVSVQ